MSLVPSPWGEQSPLEDGAHRGGPVVDPELGVDVEQMGLHRHFADEQPPCHPAVGGAGAISWSTSVDQPFG